MADMTQKHHKLIEDALNEGIAEVVDHVTKTSPQTGMRPDWLRDNMVIAMRKAFASRLAYTHDKFDHDQFRRHITGRV